MKPGMRPTQPTFSHASVSREAYSDAMVAQVSLLVVSLLVVVKEAVRTGDHETFERTNKAADALLECFANELEGYDIPTAVRIEEERLEKQRQHEKEMASLLESMQNQKLYSATTNTYTIIDPDTLATRSVPADMYVWNHSNTALGDLISSNGSLTVRDTAVTATEVLTKEKEAIWNRVRKYLRSGP